MSDDHRPGGGSLPLVLKSLNPTPELDRLAAGGMVFDNAFCVMPFARQAGPVSLPVRTTQQWSIRFDRVHSGRQTFHSHA